MDLSVHNSPLATFSRELPAAPERALLRFRNKWFLGSAHGCSCGFRHLCTESVSLGFGKPEGWFHEEVEDIEATLQIIRLIRSLVEDGAGIDCIHVWDHGGGAMKELHTLDINMARLDDHTFRFFENYRFVFLP